MKKPEDRVVYVCGCAGKVVGPSQGYCRTDNGTPCVGCGQPITVINLDRLLRIKEAALGVCEYDFTNIEDVDAANAVGCLESELAALDANPGGKP